MFATVDLSIKICYIKFRQADMAELADALDLGSSGNTRAGSTPVTRILRQSFYMVAFFSFTPRKSLGKPL